MPSNQSDQQHLRNPAGRLLLLLMRAKNVPQSTSAFVAWRDNVLLLPSSASSLDVLRHINLAMQMAEDIKAWVARLDLEDDPYIDSWYPAVKKITDELALSGRFDVVRSAITAECLSSLKLISREFNHHNLEATVTLEQLQEIQNEVTSLIDGVTTATDLDDKLRDFLLRNLEVIRRTLEEYQLAGIEPIRNAVRASYGSVITEHQAAKSTGKSDFGKRFWRLLGKIAIVSAVSESGQKLIEYSPEVLQLLQGE